MPTYYFRDGMFIDMTTGKAVAIVKDQSSWEDYQEHFRDLSPTAMNLIGY